MTGWRRLLGDRRGVAGLEFALVVSIVLLLTAGLMELGLMMIVDATMEIAIRAVSRTGSITDALTEDERTKQVEETVSRLLSGWAPGTSTVTVDTHVYPLVTDLGNGYWIEDGQEAGCQTYEGDCTGVQLIPGIGAAGSLVLYRVTLRRAGFSGVLRLIGIDDLTFSRTTVVLNE